MTTVLRTTDKMPSDKMPPDKMPPEKMPLRLNGTSTRDVNKDWICKDKNKVKNQV